MVLKPANNGAGYLYVILCRNTKQRNITIHKLVAVTFLDHKPCGLKRVVNHKNFIKSDNRLENLEIVSQRENTNQKHIKSASQYTGVYWAKNRGRWRAGIVIRSKQVYLGLYEDQYTAHLAYEAGLKYFLETNLRPSCKMIRELIGVPNKMNGPLYYKGKPKIQNDGKA